jgi:hypothetical protein
MSSAFSSASLLLFCSRIPLFGASPKPSAVPGMGTAVRYSSNALLHGSRSYDHQPEQHVILIRVTHRTREVLYLYCPVSSPCIILLPMCSLSTYRSTLSSNITFFAVTSHQHSPCKRICHWASFSSSTLSAFVISLQSHPLQDDRHLPGWRSAEEDIPQESNWKCSCDRQEPLSGGRTQTVW